MGTLDRMLLGFLVGIVGGVMLIFFGWLFLQSPLIAVGCGLAGSIVAWLRGTP